MVLPLGYKKTRIFLLIVVVLFSFQVGISSAGVKNTSLGDDFSGVDFKNGLLKVSVKNQKFQTVIDEVAQKTGIRIVINSPTDEDITINFDYLPLEKGFRKLLSGRSYVFFYRSGDAPQSVKLRHVLVLPKSGEGILAVPEGMVKKQFYDALEKLKKMDGLVEMKKYEDDVIQGSSQGGADPIEEINKDLEKGIQNIEKIIMDLQEKISL